MRDIQSFAEDHRVPLVHFEKGESKEERVRPLLQQTAKLVDRAGLEPRDLLIADSALSIGSRRLPPFSRAVHGTRTPRVRAVPQPRQVRGQIQQVAGVDIRALAWILCSSTGAEVGRRA